MRGDKLNPKSALWVLLGLAAITAATALAWFHPQALLYAVVAALGLGTYAGVYSIVAARLARTPARTHEPKPDRRR